ncbi:hypothetical protein DIC66_04480 [Rhodoferax lacus]|uniref:Porin n=1 Tax=Rhodoferax lacus TaxID=2184758 RepID=A0A3E1RF45_9BURK|nr:hypothetical protein [Rhodoferax lacus]RFO97988.1 hypothetical protein DIC66_04480 [Rhodoferax lacus]
MGSTGAMAQSQDLVKWRASANVQNNNNFFNTNTAPVSERLTSETLGVNLSIPYSLQRFELDASVVASQYQSNTNFDNTGTNYNGTWFWSFTPELHGTVTSSRAETLVAANDSVDRTLRNKTTAQNNAIAAAYDLGGPWQVTAGVVNTSTINERAVIGQSDNHATGANAGVRYVLGSGNSLAYFHQVSNGDSNTDYVLTTDDVAVVWVLSGNTTLNGHVASVNQKFGATPQFDFSGTSGAANLVWRLTGKTSLTAGWQRDLVSYQTLGSTHTQTDYFTIAPVWQISPVTSVRAQYRTGTLDDKGNPYGTASSRQDRLQDTSLSFSWQPYQKLSLSATIAQTSRSSTVANTDFTAQLLTLGAVFSF